jgi:transposase, IS5 family
MLPPEALVMPAKLEAVDALLDDPRFFEPFRRWFDPAFGRPSIPMETYLRLMFLKYRYRLGYETLCAEVSDSLTWLRFCRIPLGERAPHPSTLMKITTRCGSTTVTELNAHLVADGVEAEVTALTSRIPIESSSRTPRRSPSTNYFFRGKELAKFTQ